jgi:hypothetical protein
MLNNNLMNIINKVSYKKSKSKKNKSKINKNKFKNKNKNKSIFFKYKLYKKNRKLIKFHSINESFIFNKNVQVAIIIPYRNRESHLEEFYKHFKNENFDVYIIEQYDSQKFNRGLLLNAGFDIASKKKNYDYYIFHDVDSYPDKDLLQLYYYKGNKIIHYASPYLGYKYTFDDFFGGVCGMNKETYIKINGFPNHFFGWGGEDDSLYNRVSLNGFEVYRPVKGSYILAEHNSPKNEELNKNKMNNILTDLKEWKIHGYNEINDLYIILNHFIYKSTSISKSKSKSKIKSKNKSKSISKNISISKSKKGLNIEIYQLKIAQLSDSDDNCYSLMKPLTNWNEIEKHIISTYDNTKIKKYNENANKVGKIKKEIEKLVNDKIDKEYVHGLEKNDLEKTLKFIFETYRELLYFRIRNNNIELAYHLYNKNYINKWTKYIQFPDNMKPYEFIEKKRKELKSFYEPLLPENKWVANNCIVKIEGDDDKRNPVSYIKEIYTMIYNTILHFKNVPDCDLLINRKDFQYLHSNPLKYAHTYVYPNNINIQNNLLPNKYWIVASQNSSNENKDVPIPNSDEWKDIHKNMNIIEWKNKENRLIFRGSSTGCGLDENSNPRIRLSQISYLLKDIFYNIGLSKFVKKIRIQNFKYSYININKYKHLLKEFITPEEQMKAKYILNIEGNAAAYRLAGLFNMNSVIVQAESKYYNWFEPLLKDNKNYILLKKEIFMNKDDSIEESKEKVKIFFNHLLKKNNVMEKIAKNGTLFYNTYLNENTIYEYYFSLMKKINSFYKI